MIDLNIPTTSFNGKHRQVSNCLQQRFFIIFWDIFKATNLRIIVFLVLISHLSSNDVPLFFMINSKASSVSPMQPLLCPLVSHSTSSSDNVPSSPVTSLLMLFTVLIAEKSPATSALALFLDDCEIAWCYAD
jgi:hypothetical protein